MADYYLHKTAAHIDELLEKVEGLDNYDDTEVRGLINNKVDKVIGKGLSTNDFTDAYKETLDGLDTALDNKVDKETGKGLSTNDYTTSEKTKLNGIESGANVNVQVDWNQTDTTADDYIKNKPTIPTVDQTYDATSQNAQSGVAIEGKKPGEITTGKQYTIDGQTVTAGDGAEVFNDYTNNKASGRYSHAEGSVTTASGESSHAESFHTTASGDNSHSEGNQTTASGYNSHAEGFYTTASGNSSHAEGDFTIASGNNSHAEGYGTEAASTNQHVMGKLNVVDSSGTYAFIIGNGTGIEDDARLYHNAFAIDWNGLIYVNGAATGVDVSALAPQSTTYTKDEVDTSQAVQDARILFLEQRVVNHLEHYGMKWEKENSDPQARCSYLYDCANFTPMQCQDDGSVSMGSWANAFFIRNNYPAMVKPDETIEYLLDPNDHSKKLDGTASHVEDHETDNAMAIFDCHIWIKMAEDETYQYIEVANQKLDDDFVDFPYHRADGTIKDKLYYPMFEGSMIGGKLRSLATGAVPQSNTTAPEEQSAAQANGANWSIGDWSHHLWMTLLSMLVGKTTCPEMAFGEGHTTGGSSATDLSKCGELKTAGQFYGKPQAVSTTNPVKLFFSENPYGNRWKRTLGMYNVRGTYYIKSSPPYTVDESYDGYENCGSNPSNSRYVKDLKLTSMGFVPSTVGGSASTYTGTYYYENDARIDMLVVGGGCSDGAGCGFWFLGLNYRPSNQFWNFGASLYLM